MPAPQPCWSAGLYFLPDDGMVVCGGREKEVDGDSRTGSAGTCDHRDVGCGVGRTATASADPIVVIVMENQPYGTIVGSQQAPFINNVMIARGTLATNYVANINGSLRTISR